MSITEHQPQISPAASDGSAATNGARPKAVRLVARKQRNVVPQRLWRGMLMLLQAYDYAQETGRDGKDFAVEVADLRRRGMTNSDCRWFVCKGWAQLARELKPRPGEARRLEHEVGLAIYRHACMLLTPSGERIARRLATRTKDATRVEHHQPARASNAGQNVPIWDRDRHELRLDSRLIKQFKLPSPNQEMILAVFDEENWPARIDDPLPPSKRVNAKQRLHDTIKNLNRNQKHRLIRFLGDGTGQGVRWELIVDGATEAPPQA